MSNAVHDSKFHVEWSARLSNGSHFSVELSQFILIFKIITHTHTHTHTYIYNLTYINTILYIYIYIYIYIYAIF